MNPSDSRSAPLRFRLLIRSSRWPPHPTKRVSSTAQCVFLSMPSLLPRESTCATSVLTPHVQRPSPFDHRVGFPNSFTRLLMSSLALRPAHLLFENSRPQITPAPLPHATKVYGQLLGRDFNPLDTLLLLRTVRPLLYISSLYRDMARPLVKLGRTDFPAHTKEKVRNPFNSIRN